jgi:hypothetical protein
MAAGRLIPVVRWVRSISVGGGGALGSFRVAIINNGTLVNCQPSGTFHFTVCSLDFASAGPITWESKEERSCSCVS